MAATPPVPPVRTKGPGPTWRHGPLYDRVLAALHALPSRFTSSLVIEGLPVTDLFTMNTPLGAAIEASVVDSLNALRDVWDPESAFASYAFVRQSQTFPDVLLKTSDPTAAERVLMGIELKGWFAIAKEAEPSYRYVAATTACADADLLVVIPWIFDSVVSGKPKLLQPIITEAKYAALMRNHWWEFVRNARSPIAQRGIVSAQHIGSYPSKSQQYLDRAVHDGGNNFGRIARCGVMDAEVQQTLNESALGIPLLAWSIFLSIFADQSSVEDVARRLAALERSLGKPPEMTLEQRQDLLIRIREIAELLISVPPLSTPTAKRAKESSSP